MNDESDDYGEVIVLISVFFMVVIVGIVLIIRFLGGYTQVSPDIDCASQVLANARVSTISKGYANPDINCPTKEIVLQGADENLLKRTLAEEMATCWSVWGKGKYTLFTDDDITFCHVCATVQADGVENLDSFPSYLAQNKIDGDQSYLEYISGQLQGDYFTKDDFKSVSTYNMPTDQLMGVFFYYAKGHSTFENFMNSVFSNPKSGAAWGAAVGVGVASVVSAGTIPTGVIVLGGGVVGGASGFLLHEPASSVSMVVVRPLTADGIKDLGCMYAPAAN